MSSATYAVVTPARNEAANLRRLACALTEQTRKPTCWMIVDNGSTDDTPTVIAKLTEELHFARAIDVGGPREIERGGPIVRAFCAGLEALPEAASVVVKLDADVSFGEDYFDRLIGEFDGDPDLGIASGSAWEWEEGEWVKRHVTADSVWGASRAYRWECLQAVLPLEERMGWDGVDALKANLRGWETRTLVDLPFRHHRAEGQRDGARRRAWAAQGRASRFMGYRLGYLFMRSLHHSLREPAALSMIGGYIAAALRAEPRCSDPEVRDYLRQQQRIRDLPRRALEAFGRTVPSRTEIR